MIVTLWCSICAAAQSLDAGYVALRFEDWISCVVASVDTVQVLRHMGRTGRSCKEVGVEDVEATRDTWSFHLISNCLRRSCNTTLRSEI